MGLPWVRLDTNFAQNPKILYLTHHRKWRTAFVYITALTYAGANGTGGYIPEYCLQFINATRQNAVELVKAGLWHDDVGGWRINGWEEFQMCDEAAVQRSNKARKAAIRRWGGTDA